jgi:hypothetical protein
MRKTKIKLKTLKTKVKCNQMSLSKIKIKNHRKRKTLKKGIFGIFSEGFSLFDNLQKEILEDVISDDDNAGKKK